MKFTKLDKSSCENLVRALKKSKFELEGMEVLAMADVFKWVNRLYATIQMEITADAALATAEEPITNEESSDISL